MPMPQIIPPSLTVVPLDDPVVERHGFGPNSVYVEFVYLPILGATTVWLYRRLGVLVLTADSTVVDLAELGRNLGVGGAGRNAPLVRSLRRLELFGGASWNGEIYAVRRALAPISERQLQRLPTLAKTVHRRAQQRHGPEHPHHARHRLTVWLHVLTIKDCGPPGQALVDRSLLARPRTSRQPGQQSRHGARPSKPSRSRGVGVGCRSRGSGVAVRLGMVDERRVLQTA